MPLNQSLEDRLAAAEAEVARLKQDVARPATPAGQDELNRLRAENTQLHSELENQNRRINDLLRQVRDLEEGNA